MKKFLKKHKTKLYWVLGIIVVSVFAYLLLSQEEETGKNFYVIEEVSNGDVNSGITTSGSILAAQKLDLNIYKQTTRIDSVTISNGQHVDKDGLLFAFDSSDVSVAINRYSINAKEARLEIAEQKIQNGLENTTESELVQSIYDLKQKIKNAQRNYFSLDFEAVPVDEEDAGRTKPIISGEYNSDIVGSYIVEVYSSSSDYGLSIRYSGLESGRSSIHIDEPLKIGTRGVHITFSDDIKKGDEWVISLPNNNSQTAVSNLEDYNDLIKSYESELTSREQSLETLQRTTGDTYKSIDLQKAQLSLSEANQSLREKYELRDERQVIAPFSGTVEGIENVVVGATPTNSSEDPVQFGTLISDEFYASFSLNATEVSTVSLGQKVLVTVSSAQGEEVLVSEIVEISSLPTSSSTPQYEVNALVTLTDENTVVLREGILADIQIITDEKSDVVRVPSSALEYRGRQASILLIPTLSDSEKNSVDTFGVLEQQDTSFESYRIDVEVGISGQFFTEIISGVEAGDYIVLSSSTSIEESVVEQSGPGGGGGPPDGGGQRS